VTEVRVCEQLAQSHYIKMSRLELVKPAGLSGKSGTLLHWVKLQDAKLGIFIFIAKSKQT